MTTTTKHVVWIPMWLALLAGCSAPAFGSDPFDPNPSDEALLQANRAARDNLKKPPEDREHEVLWISNGVQLVLSPTTVDSLRERAALAAMERAEAGESGDAERPADELAAMATAQDATLKLLNGEAQVAREMLELSMAQYPTLDALVPLAAMLEAEQDDAGLVEHCVRARDAVPESQVLAVLQTCHERHSAEDVETSLSWASEGDRTRLAVTLAP